MLEIRNIELKKLLEVLNNVNTDFVHMKIDDNNVISFEESDEEPKRTKKDSKDNTRNIIDPNELI